MKAARAPVPQTWHLQLWPACLAVALSVGAGAWRWSPRGVCFGDSGGLQLAAGTLGITHPPGYSLFTCASFAVSLVPGISPAGAVTLLCVLSAVLVVVMGVLLLARAGVPPPVAAAAMLLWCAHPGVWFNATVPEVYMPSLALVLVGVFLGSQRRDARFLSMRAARLGACLAFGLAVAHRAPVLLLLPFVLGAWWLGASRRRQEKVSAVAETPEALPPMRARGTSWGSWLLMLVLFAAPSFASLGYVLLRDSDSTQFNYLDQYDAEMGDLPPREGPVNRLRRAIWLTGGRQFAGKLQVRTSDIKRKLLRWTPKQMRRHWYYARFVEARGLSGTIADGLIVALVLLGIVVMYRRDEVTATMLLGLMLSSIIFVACYDAHDEAADLTPVMFAMAGFLAVSASAAFDERRAVMGSAVAWIVVVGLLVAVNVDGARRGRYGRDASAGAYLEEVNLAGLPANSVVFSEWRTSAPLWYERLYRVARPDLEIVNAAQVRWLGMASAYRDRPVYLTRPLRGVTGDVPAPGTALFRLW